MSMFVGTSISFNEGEYQWMPTIIFKINIWNVTSYILLYTTTTKKENALWIALFMDLSEITFEFNLKLFIVFCSMLDLTWNVKLKIYY